MRKLIRDHDNTAFSSQARKDAYQKIHKWEVEHEVDSMTTEDRTMYSYGEDGLGHVYQLRTDTKLKATATMLLDDIIIDPQLGYDYATSIGGYYGGGGDKEAKDAKHGFEELHDKSKDEEIKAKEKIGRKK